MFNELIPIYPLSEFTQSDRPVFDGSNIVNIYTTLSSMLTNPQENKSTWYLKRILFAGTSKLQSRSPAEEYLASKLYALLLGQDNTPSMILVKDDNNQLLIGSKEVENFIGGQMSLAEDKYPDIVNFAETLLAATAILGERDLCFSNFGFIEKDDKQFFIKIDHGHSFEFDILPTKEILTPLGLLKFIENLKQFLPSTNDKDLLINYTHTMLSWETILNAALKLTGGNDINCKINAIHTLINQHTDNLNTLPMEGHINPQRADFLKNKISNNLITLEKIRKDTLKLHEEKIKACQQDLRTLIIKDSTYKQKAEETMRAYLTALKKGFSGRTDLFFTQTTYDLINCLKSHSDDIPLIGDEVNYRKTCELFDILKNQNLIRKKFTKNYQNIYQTLEQYIIDWQTQEETINHFFKQIELIFGYSQSLRLIENTYDLLSKEYDANNAAITTYGLAI